MAKKSMADALLNQDKKYDYGMLLPFKTRRGMDEDQLSTDYMEGDNSLAVPGIIADAFNASVKGGQMIQGERPIDEEEITKQAIDILPMSGFGATMIPKAGGQVLGMNVFQGGPHKYGPEGAAKSLQHMSKGEGAQAYGWGRYDADAEDVGKQYRDSLSANYMVKTDGTQDTYSAAVNDVFRAIDESTGGLPLSSKEQIARNVMDGVYETGSAKKYLNAYENPAHPAQTEMHAAYEAAHKRVSEMGYTRHKGNLYKHDLPDEDIARYLDHDKPLSEQPEVFGQLKRHWDETIGDPDIIMQRMELTENSSGKDLYQALAGLGRDDKGASEALARAGIPGLKYYDQMSRLSDGGADAKGTATRILDAAGGNYDKAIEIAKGRQARNNKGPVDPTSNLSKAIKLLENKFDTRTRNYVTWDQEVLNRMKLLERNGESMIDALR